MNLKQLLRLNLRNQNLTKYLKFIKKRIRHEIALETSATQDRASAIIATLKPLDISAI